MKNRKLLIGNLIACALICTVEPVFAAKITNKDVMELVKAGIPEAVVIQAIESGEPSFDTSASAIGAMKNQGIGDAIIQKMVLRQFSGATASTQQPQGIVASQQLGPCKFDPTDNSQLIHDGNNSIKGVLKNIDKSKSVDTGSVILSKLTFGIVSAKGKASIGVPGDKADVRLTSVTPIFKELYVVDDTATSDMIKLVRFEVRDGNRVFDTVSAERGLLKSGGGSNLNLYLQLKFTPTGVSCSGTSRRNYGRRFIEIEVQPAQPLGTGEYGLLIGKKILDFGVD